MMIDVVATSDFIHGKLNMTKREEGSLPEQLAKDLLAVGLVVLAIDAVANKAAMPSSNKMAPVARNKAAKPAKIESKVEEQGGGALAIESADVCTDAPGVIVVGAGSDAGAVGDVAPSGVAPDGAAA